MTTSSFILRGIRVRRMFMSGWFITIRQGYVFGRAHAQDFAKFESFGSRRTARHYHGTTGTHKPIL